MYAFAIFDALIKNSINNIVWTAISMYNSYRQFGNEYLVRILDTSLPVANGASRPPVCRPPGLSLSLPSCCSCLLRLSFGGVVCCRIVCWFLRLTLWHIWSHDCFAASQFVCCCFRRLLLQKTAIFGAFRPNDSTGGRGSCDVYKPVSYTHLTLPTILRV